MINTSGLSGYALAYANAMNNSLSHGQSLTQAQNAGQSAANSQYGAGYGVNTSQIYHNMYGSSSPSSSVHTTSSTPSYSSVGTYTPSHSSSSSSSSNPANVDTSGLSGYALAYANAIKSGMSAAQADQAARSSIGVSQTSQFNPTTGTWSNTPYVPSSSHSSNLAQAYQQQMQSNSQQWAQNSDPLIQQALHNQNLALGNALNQMGYTTNYNPTTGQWSYGNSQPTQNTNTSAITNPSQALANSSWTFTPQPITGSPATTGLNTDAQASQASAPTPPLSQQMAIAALASQQQDQQSQKKQQDQALGNIGTDVTQITDIPTLYQMAQANSAAWGQTTDPSTKAALHQQNVAIQQQIARITGAPVGQYDPTTGTWSNASTLGALANGISQLQQQQQQPVTAQSLLSQLTPDQLAQLTPEQIQQLEQTQPQDLRTVLTQMIENGGVSQQQQQNMYQMAQQMAQNAANVQEQQLQGLVQSLDQSKAADLQNVQNQLQDAQQALANKYFQQYLQERQQMADRGLGNSGLANDADTRLLLQQQQDLAGAERDAQTQSAQVDANYAQKLADAQAQLAAVNPQLMAQQNYMNMYNAYMQNMANAYRGFGSVATTLLNQLQAPAADTNNNMAKLISDYINSQTSMTNNANDNQTKMTLGVLPYQYPTQNAVLQAQTSRANALLPYQYPTQNAVLQNQMDQNRLIAQVNQWAVQDKLSQETINNTAQQIADTAAYQTGLLANDAARNGNTAAATQINALGTQLKEIGAQMDNIRSTGGTVDQTLIDKYNNILKAMSSLVGGSDSSGK